MNDKHLIELIRIYSFGAGTVAGHGKKHTDRHFRRQYESRIPAKPNQLLKPCTDHLMLVYVFGSNCPNHVHIQKLRSKYPAFNP